MKNIIKKGSAIIIALAGMMIMSTTFVDAAVTNGWEDYILY